ncbi:MAG TPA: response regulator [Anaerolineales bacterium]|nr:response regulator [Anaerolineales bacterium]
MPKILIAEDDHTMVSLLKTLLNLEGFDVVEVDVEADVLSVVSRETPDVLLMDVHLGEQNGMDIVASIRQKTDFSRMNIVMTSGLDVKNECLERGANHFLLKPFMPDDLLKVLRN